MQKFDWNPECQIAFDFLKESLTTIPAVLAYPDTYKPYILYTDASEECIGSCLCQVHDEGANTDDKTPKRKTHLFPVTQTVSHSNSVASHRNMKLMQSFMHYRS